jgi:hypothetical protein
MFNFPEFFDTPISETVYQLQAADLCGRRNLNAVKGILTSRETYVYIHISSPEYWNKS